MDNNILRVVNSTSLSVLNIVQLIFFKIKLIPYLYKSIEGIILSGVLQNVGSLLGVVSDL